MAKKSSRSCVVCGWTTEQQDQCFYSSHAKLFYGASRRGLWSIGSDVIMKESPDEGPKTELITLNHLAAAYPDTILAPKFCATGLITMDDTLCFKDVYTDKHSSRLGLPCQNPRKGI